MGDQRVSSVASRGSAISLFTMQGSVVDLRWLAIWTSMARVVGYIAGGFCLAYWALILAIEPVVSMPTGGDAFAGLYADALGSCR